jgi:translocation and assembly module TamB
LISGFHCFSCLLALLYYNLLIKSGKFTIIKAVKRRTGLVSQILRSINRCVEVSMTDTPPSPPNESQVTPTDRGGILRFLKRRSPVILGTTLVVLGSGYIGLRWWVYRYLPGTIEAKLEPILNRDIEVGAVRRFPLLLTGLELGPTFIPPADYDRTDISVQAIRVNFNLMPLLWGKLPIELTLIEPRISASQDAKGNWVTLKLNLPEPKELPIDLESNLQVQDAAIALLPYGAKNPVTITADGTVQLREKNKLSRYDFQVGVAKGQLVAQGETRLKTGQTKAIVRIQDLQLTEFNPFIPKSVPVSLRKGEVDANLNLDLPSFEAWKSANVLGIVQLSQIEAIAQPLTEPLKAEGVLRFKGQTATIDLLRGELGELEALITGQVDARSGFDVKVDVPEFDIASALALVPTELPVSLGGSLAAQLQVSGDLDDPTVTGTVENGKPLQVDRLELATLDVKFTADRDRAVLDRLQITPSAGGQIRGNGALELAAQQLDFDFAADLPIDALAASYDLPPQIQTQVQVGTLVARGEIGGTIQNPNALVTWRLPGATATLPTSGGIGITGDGEVTLRDRTIALNQTTLRVGEGTVAIAAFGDLNTQDWNADIATTSIPLAPFLPEQFAAIPSLSLQQGNITASGKLDELDLNGIEAIANLNLAIDRGTIATLAQLNRGQVTVTANSQDVPLDWGLEPICRELPISCPSVTLANSQVNLSTSVDALLLAAQTQNLTGIDATANVQLGVDDGTVNATTSLTDGQVNAIVDTQQLQLDKWLPDLPISVALLDSRVNFSGSVETLLNAAQTQDLTRLNATINARLGVNEGTVTTQTQLNNGQLEIVANAGQIGVNTVIPNLPANIALLDAQVNTSGAIATFLNAAQTQDFTGINATVNARLGVNEGIVTTQTQIDRGQVDLVANAEQIQLNAIVPDLPASVQLIDSQTTLSASIDSLLLAAQTRDVSGINANINARVGVNESTTDAIAQIQSGTLNLTADTTNLALNAIVPNLPLPVTLQNSQLTLATELNPLIAAAQTQNWQQLNPRLNLDANLAVAGGTVATTTALLNGEWQSAIAASQINPSEVLQAVNPQSKPTNETLPPLNANVNLAGTLSSLLALNTIPIEIENANIQLGAETLTANGGVVLTNLTTAPDVANLDLQVTTRYNTATLPLEQLIAAASQGQATLPDTVAIAVRSTFAGRIRGQNILSNPLAPGNLQVTGDLQLADLRLNDIVFEPLLSGPVSVRSGEEAAIDLRGQRDRIFAQLEPCTLSTCLAPYLPVAFEVRQGDAPLLAKGERRGEVLDVQLENFSLALLNIAPGTQAGIQGAIGGEVTGNLAVNLTTLDTEGRVQLLQPSLGYLQAEAFTGNFSYQNGVARLDRATFQLGRSQYQIEGGVNFDLDRLLAGNFDLNSTPITGRVTVTEGYVEDLLAALQWFEIEDLQRGIGSPVYGSPADLQVSGVGRPDEPLRRQLDLFIQINDLLQQRVALLRGVQPPQQLDITGSYTAELTVGGTIGNPEAQFDFQAADWQWRPYAPVAVPGRQGVSVEQGRTVTIDRIVARGGLENGVLTVDPAEVQLGATLMSLRGQASAAAQSATFQLANLPLSTLAQFAPIPPEAKGTINVAAEVGGTRSQPQLQGQVSFVEASWKNQPLDAIVGNFGYADGQFQLATVMPEYLQVAAAVPFPTTPGTNDRATLNLNVGTEATKLLPIFTGGQVEWMGGEMGVQLTASTTVDLAADDPVAELLRTLEADGTIAFQEASVKAAALEAPLMLNGAIALTPATIRAENLQGALGGGTIAISGELPTLYPRSVEQPLTVALSGDKWQIPGLFKGKVGGEIRVTGAAIAPVVSGGVDVAEGRLIAPVGGGTTVAAAPVENAAENLADAPFLPEFDRFKLRIGKNFRVVREPFMNVRLQGAVTVDGTLDNLQPAGRIELTRGVIRLLDTRFFIPRDRPQTVVFVPSQGLFNPNVDLELVTLVFEDRRSRLRDRTEVEIPDPEIAPVLRPQQIDVRIVVKGSAQELLAAMQDRSTLLSAEGTGTSAVRLTSIPSRSQSEIVALLGGRVITSIDEIAGLQGTEFVEFALLRYVAQPLADNIIFDIEDFVSGVGRKIGLQDLRVFPLGQVEGIYNLTDDASIRTTYDYEFGNVQVQYEMRW